MLPLLPGIYTRTRLNEFIQESFDNALALYNAGKPASTEELLRLVENIAKLPQGSFTEIERQAYYYLGLAYLKGFGVARNDSMAIISFTQASSNNKGLPEATHARAGMYEQGRATEGDLAFQKEMAYHLYHSAAQRGYTPSQQRLAEMYENGIGTGVDLIEAMRWYVLATQNGLNCRLNMRRLTKRKDFT